MRGRKVDDPIERAMRRAYANQRSRAKGRGIAFEFTFEQWREWWQREWHLRGRNYKQFVMGRKNDRGPYSPGNAICISAAQNTLEMVRRHKEELQKHRSRPHLHMRGDAHPRSRSVRTPAGIFGSAALAAEAYDMTRQNASRMARLGLEGWSYADGPGDVS